VVNQSWDSIQVRFFLLRSKQTTTNTNLFDRHQPHASRTCQSPRTTSPWVNHCSDWPSFICFAEERKKTTDWKRKRQHTLLCFDDTKLWEQHRRRFDIACQTPKEEDDIDPRPRSIVLTRVKRKPKSRNDGLYFDSIDLVGHILKIERVTRVFVLLWQRVWKRTQIMREWLEAEELTSYPPMFWW